MAKTTSLTFLGQKPLGIDSLVGKISEGKIDGETIYSMEVSEVYRNERNEVDTRQSLEFARYKQDCRKRSLELAASIYENEGEDFDITAKAEEYYNWLISIP